VSKQDAMKHNNFFDKNSLSGGSNIKKRKECVNGILAQDLGFAWGAFQ
jgi:hypothetical protein